MMQFTGFLLSKGLAFFCLGMFLSLGTSAPAQAKPEEQPALRKQLASPLLFVKRNSYQGIHIYDTYYQWWPGGGIYVLENPAASPDQHRIRPIIDPSTPESLGEGVYSDPDLSWDATKILFCFKGEEKGGTSIYEIGVDGAGLRRLTSPESCPISAGRFACQHDISPAYLADGRIVLTSTRPNGLVPCNNTGVDILHIMESDGSGLRAISVNNVNEFDPCLMPDGRLLFGRWEYVDKTALTQQSLWTIFPDGAFETALFANNLVRPEAFLDARPVPGAPHLIAATLTKHNSTPRGTVGIVNTRLSKNALSAIHNFDTPDSPENDDGNSCEPWPLSSEVLLYSGRPKGKDRNLLLLSDNKGNREIILEDSTICLHSPIPLRPRKKPQPLAERDLVADKTGRFYVQDIYQGMPEVERGSVKWLRVLEETSRESAGSPGGPYNQTFLVSAALAFSVKNYLGLAPVYADGSAHFEAPSGRALYLQALDGEGRLVRSMRTFIQAAPGTTRSCIGCHEHKYDAPTNQGIKAAHKRAPDKLQDESWGSGYIDYPSMIQPLLDRHCLDCHGGEKGISGSLDLSGGWTEYFNISYENLVNRRESQMTASLIGGIDCMNGTAHWSAQLFPAKSHGSAVAPLAEVLMSGHHDRLPALSRPERDLLMAWIDSNGLYYGAWDYCDNGAQAQAWPATKQRLISAMEGGGCMACHRSKGKVQFENDWFNLQQPALSRILRAPLAKSDSGFGLGLCREEKAQVDRQRLRLLVSGGYAHGVLPIENFIEQGKQPDPRPAEAAPASPFSSVDAPTYQQMLAIIRAGRREALSTPRVDMPGVVAHAGRDRQLTPPDAPAESPVLLATLNEDGSPHLAWERSARTIGLVAELYRGKRPAFIPSTDTALIKTRGFAFADHQAPEGPVYYALVLRSGDQRSAPSYAMIEVPEAPLPAPPQGLQAKASAGAVLLDWREKTPLPLRYHVYRAPEGSNDFVQLTDTATTHLSYEDRSIPEGLSCAYQVRSVNRRNRLSPATMPVMAAALPEIKAPVFKMSFENDTLASLYGGGALPGLLFDKARIRKGAIDLRRGGHLQFDYQPAFSLRHRLSVSCWVYFEEAGSMPVIVSCGAWNEGGWFLQRLGEGFRWYVDGLCCDGGEARLGEWIHLLGVFDGKQSHLYQNGVCVGSRTGRLAQRPWESPLHIGQYSGGPAPAYQVDGKISALEVFNRSLSAEEAAAATQTPPKCARPKEGKISLKIS